VEELTAKMYEANKRIDEERALAESQRSQSLEYSEHIKQKIHQSDSYEARLQDAQSMIGQLQVLPCAHAFKPCVSCHAFRAVLSYMPILISYSHSLTP